MKQHYNEFSMGGNLYEDEGKLTFKDAPFMQQDLTQQMYGTAPADNVRVVNTPMPSPVEYVQDTPYTIREVTPTKREAKDIKRYND